MKMTKIRPHVNHPQYSRALLLASPSHCTPNTTSSLCRLPLLGHSPERSGGPLSPSSAQSADRSVGRTPRAGGENTRGMANSEDTTGTSLTHLGLDLLLKLLLRWELCSINGLQLPLPIPTGNECTELCMYCNMHMNMCTCTPLHLCSATKVLFIVQKNCYNLKFAVIILTEFP